MKKTNLRKAVAAFVAIMMLATLSPLVFADGENVIFAITVEQELGTSVPFAEGVSGVEITSPYKFMKGTTTAYADESGQYDALDFFSQNATEEEKDNVNFGISFGKDLSTDIADPAKAFISFEFCPSAKPDVTSIYIGSMYLNNDEWVKRTPVNLAKYTSLAASTWKHLEFSLADLGVTVSDRAFEGIYFVFNNIAIPTSTGKLWDHIARAFDLAVVNSVGVGNKASITVAEGEEIDILTNTTLAVKGGAGFPAATEGGDPIKSFGSWSKGVVAANNPASEGEVGLYNLPSASSFASALAGNIEDYKLVVTFTKAASNGYIEDIEMGFGNANGTSGYTKLPSVVRTSPLGDFGYTTAANGTEWTITVGSVKSILENGNEIRIPGTNGGTINELTASNINLFAVKGTYRMASSATAQMIKFSSIKLIAAPVELRNTTASGSDISWAESSAKPLCYSVFKADGTKLCDTTDTTVAGTAGGTYSVFAYYGNDNYSTELVIEPISIPQAYISVDGDNIVFNFGGSATSGAVAIIAEYTATYNKLENITILPIAGATGVPAVLTVPKPQTTNKVKAFISSDLTTTLSPLAPALSLN